MTFQRPTLIINGEKNESGIPILHLERRLLEPYPCPVKARIDRLVEQGQNAIVLNLEHLPKVDSADIGKLIRAHLSVRKYGCRIHICEIHPEVMHLSSGV